MICVSIPSIIATEFPDQQEIYLGYAGMAMGVGLCAGPLMGSLVYSFLNYVQTFYLFSGYVFLTGILAIFMIPSKVNVRNNRSITEEEGFQYGITYKEIA